MKHLCRLVAFLAFALPATAHAQLPTNNDVWKTRCTVLNSMSASLKTGSASPQVTAATKGVAGEQFYTLAVNRSQATEHYVACTLYYLAAISEIAGNGGKPAPKKAKTDAILADAELKLATKTKLTMQEHLKRGEMKVEDVKGLSLNGDQTAAVINAASTMPLSLKH